MAPIKFDLWSFSMEKLLSRFISFLKNESWNLGAHRKIDMIWGQIEQQDYSLICTVKFTIYLIFIDK